MSHENDINQTFFRRLANDASANTIAICAASLVPLMAMVGGGVDASRYYMAETRLQAACDAGALAGRHAMDDGQFDVKPEGAQYTPKQTAENFFDQNFEDGLFGTEGLSRSYSSTEDGQVRGVASGTIPTSIMGAFGYEEFGLSVECQADINISNTDIMFVVDTTGSMAFRVDGSDCGLVNGLWVECSDSRMRALRTATMSFYDTVESSTSASAQVRYGMVPYSSSVNVGAAIVAENVNWMAQSHDYQSREGEWVTGYDPVTYDFLRTGSAQNYRYVDVWTDTTAQTSLQNCQNRLNQLNQSTPFHSKDDEPNWHLLSATQGTPRTAVYDGYATYDHLRFRSSGSSYSGGVCTLKFNRYRFEAASEITTTEVQTVADEYEWIYRQTNHSLAGLYDDNRIDLPTGWEGGNETYTWNGCVENAVTVPDASFDPVPSGARDLDINLIPSTNEERWKPALPDLVWMRETNIDEGFTRADLRTQSQNSGSRMAHPNLACPQAATRLTDMTRAQLQTAVNNLVPNGATYHDIGMIWGARFISPRGIFSSDNAAAPNGDAIARHIVFLTDGELQPNSFTYTPYGVEWWDQRIHSAENEAQVTSNHAERFQAACRAARQENISVWVVAFGTTLTQNLIDCATPGRAFAATNATDLDDRFKEIAQQIAALRLTQ